MPTWAMWVILAGLLTVRGLMAAVEAALQSISDLRARELVKEEPRRGNRVLLLKLDREATAAALRLGMVILGFLAAAIAVLVPPRLLNMSLASVVESEWLATLTGISSAILVALMATLVDVSFRSAALQRPESWALSFSFLALVAIRLLSLPLKLLVAPVNLVLKPFHAKVTFQPPPPPLEELEKQLISEAQKQELDQGAPQLIRSIFELSDKTCRDVMVPRTNVVAIDVSTSVDKILELIAEQNHSRIPVYKEDVDHIVGILHVRDLVPLTQNPALIVLQDLIRPVEFVPWVKPIADLLREMQRQRIHMAVVVDEYGGFSGIVTLEDILREIVGDIRDEFDEDVRAFEKLPDGSFLVDAMLPRDDFAKAFDFRFPDGDFETLGGFLSHVAGSIPDTGDRFVSGGYTFVVHSKQGPRLERIKVTKTKTVSAELPNPRTISADFPAPRPSAAKE